MSLAHQSANQEGADAWPQWRAETLDWLINGTLSQRFLDNIFVAFCQRLRVAGVPIARATMHLQTNHPQWLGTRFLWKPEMADADVEHYDYDVIQTDQFRNSPAAVIRSGVEQLRKRLDSPETDPRPFPLYAELRAEGLTDYVAWPLRFTLGKTHIATFAADRPGGFTTGELHHLAELLPALALVTEVRLKNRLTRLMLDTYVGPHASQMILDGATTRGSGTTVDAAIMVIDLRGFTEISELWPRDDVISLLNEYFDAISLPIERHGGEILKFMGDGLLATFPLEGGAACPAAFTAVREVGRAMRTLNAARATRGMQPLGFGIGVNVGAVMYGNIGSRSRLDFTVIGPAVNVAARLERLTKELDQNVLFSGTFAALARCSGTLERIGTFPLRGIGEPMEVFAFSDEDAALGPDGLS